MLNREVYNLAVPTLSQKKGLVTVTKESNDITIMGARIVI